MEILILLLLVFGVGLPLGIAQARKRRELRRQVARMLGLRTPDSLSSGRLAGTLAGYKVEVRLPDGGRSRSNRRTRISIRPPRSLPGGVDISPEGIGAGLQKLFGTEDIETGDGGFDAAVLVKGLDESAVKSLLTAERRALVTKWMDAHSSLRIRSHGIELALPEGESDARTITDTVHGLIGLGASLLGEPMPDLPSPRRMIERQNLALGTTASATSVEPTSTASVTVDELLNEVTAEQREAMDASIPDALLPDAKETVAKPAETPAGETPRSDEATDVPGPGITIEEGTQGSTLDPEALCVTLFDAQRFASETDRIFAQTYAGEELAGHGRLDRVEEFPFDFVFGQRPGTKATVVYERKTPGLAAPRVPVILHLPPGAATGLASLVGEQVRFRGILLKADAFMRRLFVDQGSVERA